MKVHKLLVPLVLFISPLFYYFPLLAAQQKLVERGNDLQEFFWPVAYYVKQQILVHQTFPLWNNLFFSGMPLLPDPQSPLFYPPNLVHLILPTGIAFIFLFFLHAYLGAVGMYFLSKDGLRLTRVAAVFTAVLYTFSHRLASYIEAGHVGLVYAWGWVPYVFLSTIKLATKPSRGWVVIFAVSNAALFFTRTITFLLTLFVASFIFLYIQFLYVG